MNKWIAIPVITILAVGIIVVGYLYLQQTSKLGEAESEAVALEGNVSTLEGDVSTLETELAGSEATVLTLEGNVSTLETDLAGSEATVSTLEADLGTANSRITDLQGDVSTQRSINSSLSSELKKVKDPRHFASITELADWLRDDDADTKYEDEETLTISYILQVRALRDGYLLPVTITPVGTELWVYNAATIGDFIYGVNAWDDHTELIGWLSEVPPSHPLPLN